ncbi:MAG: hypothetical protein OEW15_17670 [Nitrospirota bacterium]|nr:hypothetical protein [Nitrospirota bacterium]
MERKFYAISIINLICEDIDAEDGGTSYFASEHQRYLDYINRALPDLDATFSRFLEENSQALRPYEKCRFAPEGHLVEADKGIITIGLGELLEGGDLAAQISPDGKSVRTGSGNFLKDVALLRLVFAIPGGTQTEQVKIEFLFHQAINLTYLRKFGERVLDVFKNTMDDRVF